MNTYLIILGCITLVFLCARFVLMLGTELLEFILKKLTGDK